MPQHSSASRSTVVLLTHHEVTGSRVDAALALAVATFPDVEVRDLTAMYPDGSIDVPTEQATVAGVEQIILQYPTDWYSVPALMNHWLEKVLTQSWADEFGVADKILRVMTSTGSVAEAYSNDTFHAWPYRDILKPLEATAKRLGMTWAEPLVVHGAADLSDANFTALADQYRAVLDRRNESSSTSM